MDPDDSTLWSRSRTGDTDAFGQLFERHARAIYNYCFRRTSDWSLAEDLVSLVFLEAWRRREKDLPPGKVLPWLYGIATNVLRNRRRSDRRFAAALGRVPMRPPEPGFANDADDRIDDERQMKRILGVISQLPWHEQNTFVLSAWVGLSYEEISVALDIPIGTVRSRLSRARERLRELDSTFGHEEERTLTSQEATKP